MLALYSTLRESHASMRRGGGAEGRDRDDFCEGEDSRDNIDSEGLLEELEREVARTGLRSRLTHNNHPIHPRGGVAEGAGPGVGSGACSGGVSSSFQFAPRGGGVGGASGAGDGAGVAGGGGAPSIPRTDTQNEPPQVYMKKSDW